MRDEFIRLEHMLERMFSVHGFLQVGKGVNEKYYIIRHKSLSCIKEYNENCVILSYILL